MRDTTFFVFSTCSLYYFLYLFENPAMLLWMRIGWKFVRRNLNVWLINSYLSLFYTYFWRKIIDVHRERGTASYLPIHFSGLFHILIIIMGYLEVEMKLLFYTVEMFQVKMLYRTVVNWRNSACYDPKITCTISVTKEPALIKVNALNITIKSWLVILLQMRHIIIQS